MYTAIILDAKASTLVLIIHEKVLPDSIVHTDSFPVYDVLDVSEFHHRRVNHSKVFVTRRGHHINGIENFWNQAKRHLQRFNGIPKRSFYGFLKVCEWRFNGGGYKALLQQLRAWYHVELNKPQLLQPLKIYYIGVDRHASTLTEDASRPRANLQEE